MRIDVLTLFPEMFVPLDESIVKRARAKGLVDLQITNIRDFTTDNYHTADDRLYGGGAGMVLKPEPLFAAISAVQQKDKNPYIIITSPAGEVFDQAKAKELAQAEQLIFVCGHYEGIDQRVEDTFATHVISMGDFVLTGGELPAMAMIDAVVRLQPGALGDATSPEEESFAQGLLEYPQYTRPAVFKGLEVPEVLLAGNHEEIRKWRREQSLKRTLKRRPELLKEAFLTKEDTEMLAVLKNKIPDSRLWIALVHYPVYNKKKEIINTSITNLDLHDIARAAITFGLEGFYVVQPIESQREMIAELLKHWQIGFGSRYNPNRHEALNLVQQVESLVAAVAEIVTKTGETPKLIGTTAQAREGMIDYEKMRAEMKKGGNYLLLLGTGWGLTDEILDTCEYVLRPIYGTGSYNHLSVRSAASIILDRLKGEKRD